MNILKNSKKRELLVKQILQVTMFLVSAVPMVASMYFTWLFFASLGVIYGLVGITLDIGKNGWIIQWNRIKTIKKVITILLIATSIIFTMVAFFNSDVELKNETKVKNTKYKTINNDIKHKKNEIIDINKKITKEEKNKNNAIVSVDSKQGTNKLKIAQNYDENIKKYKDELKSKENELKTLKSQLDNTEEYIYEEMSKGVNLMIMSWWDGTDKQKRFVINMFVAIVIEMLSFIILSIRGEIMKDIKILKEEIEIENKQMQLKNEVEEIAKTSKKQSKIEIVTYDENEDTKVEKINNELSDLQKQIIELAIKNDYILPSRTKIVQEIQGSTLKTIQNATDDLKKMGKVYKQEGKKHLELVK